MSEKEKTIYLNSNVNELYASTEITQYFSNPLNSPIELSVSFPITDEISLSKFIITVDENVYISKVMEKEKAEEKYGDAISSGNAGLIASFNTDLQSYSVNIGNIEPKQKVKLITSFIQMIGTDDMSYEFRIIKNYPCFTYKELEAKEENVKIEANIEIIAHSKITRLTSPFILNNLHTFSKYEVKFENDYKIANIKILNNSKNLFDLFEKEKSNLKNSYSILFRTENMNLPTLYYQYDPKLKEYSYSINYVYNSNTFKTIPNPEIPDQDPTSYYYEYMKNSNYESPGIFIFLVDQSESMIGKPIELVKKYLLLFIKSLPLGSYFQLIGFGDDFIKYNDFPVKYNEENIEKIIKIIKTLRANEGHTIISKPLKDILNDKSIIDINLCKNIFVFTDGEVSEEEKNECIKIVKKCSNKYRLHSIGIDADYGINLILNIAKYGKGLVSFVYDKDKSDYDELFNNYNQTKLLSYSPIEVLNMCLRPYLIDIKFNFCNNEENYKNKIISYGSIDNFIYQDEIISFSFILDNKNKIDIDNITEEIKLEIEAKDAVNNIVKEIISTDKNKNIIKLKDGDDMAKMIVSKGLKKNKELIENEKNEIKFAKKYEILSKNTSLFVNILNNNKTIENSNLIKIKIKNFEKSQQMSINQGIIQNKIILANMMGQSNIIPMNYMNPMMMNQNIMGMNQGMPQIFMNALPPLDPLIPENKKVEELNDKINMFEKQNENFYNLINNYELKKRIIPTIEEIILINKGLILDFTEEKNIYLEKMNKMGVWVDMNLKMKKIEKPNNPNNFYSINQDILKYLEKIYIDLDLEELIISQNILEGYWDGNSESKKLIKIFKKGSYNINKEINELKIVGPTNKIVYTILAIYYLKTKYLNNYNDIKLIIDKAKKFLTKYGINYEEFENTIINSINNNNKSSVTVDFKFIGKNEEVFIIKVNASNETSIKTLINCFRIKLCDNTKVIEKYLLNNQEELDRYSIQTISSKGINSNSIISAIEAKNA